MRQVRRVQVRRAPSLRPGRRAATSRLGSRAHPGPRATPVASQPSRPRCPRPWRRHRRPWSPPHLSRLPRPWPPCRHHPHRLHRRVPRRPKSVGSQERGSEAERLQKKLDESKNDESKKLVFSDDPEHPEATKVSSALLVVAYLQPGRPSLKAGKRLWMGTSLA